MPTLKCQGQNPNQTWPQLVKYISPKQSRGADSGSKTEHNYHPKYTIGPTINRRDAAPTDSENRKLSISLSLSFSGVKHLENHNRIEKFKRYFNSTPALFFK